MSALVKKRKGGIDLLGNLDDKLGSLQVAKGITATDKRERGGSAREEVGGGGKDIQLDNSKERSRFLP